jgi:hypothetical protein
MKRAMDYVLDAIDIETFILCANEEEARDRAEGIMAELKLKAADIVFMEFSGPGARVRLRSYVHKPGDHYRWMKGEEVPK